MISDTCTTPHLNNRFKYLDGQKTPVEFSSSVINQFFSLFVVQVPWSALDTQASLRSPVLTCLTSGGGSMGYLVLPSTPNTTNNDVRGRGETPKASSKSRPKSRQCYICRRPSIGKRCATCTHRKSNRRHYTKQYQVNNNTADTASARSGEGWISQKNSGNGVKG
jgi:hypothetical protein